MLEQAFRLFNTDVAVDFGSATIRVFIRGHGLVLEEANIVTTRIEGNNVEFVALGSEAKIYVGRTPKSMETHFPIQGSVIKHFDLALALCRHVLQKVLGKSLLIKPKLLWIMPHGISPQAKEKYLKILYSVGNRESVYVDSLICSGIGCKLPVNEPIGSLVLDIGHGSSKLGLLSLSGITAHGQTRFGGETLSFAIRKWLERKDIAIGPVMATTIKEAIAEADAPNPQRTIRFSGRRISSGMAEEITLSSTDIFEALQFPLNNILAMFKRTMANITPELASDIWEQGIMLCGGSAQLQGIDDFFFSHLKIPTFVSEQPSLRNIEGGGALLEDSNLLDWVGEGNE